MPQAIPQAKTLVELTRKLAVLEAQQEWVTAVLQAYGIQGVWLSPAKAASILNVSRDRLMGEIHRAERLRVKKKKGDCLYDVHYRDDRDPEEGVEPVWKVNIIEFRKLLAIPPDERKV